MRSARMRRSRSSRSRAWATRPRASSVSEAICACSSAATGRVSPREARSAASRCRRSASWRRTPASSGVSITSPAAVTSLAASAARSWLSREPASACSVRATASALPTSRSWFAVVAGSPTAAASISRRRAWMPRFCSAMRARRSPISPRIQASARSAASRLVRSCATRYSSTTALANTAAATGFEAVATTSMTTALRLRVTERPARSASTTRVAAGGGSAASGGAATPASQPPSPPKARETASGSAGAPSGAIARPRASISPSRRAAPSSTGVESRMAISFETVAESEMTGAVSTSAISPSSTRSRSSSTCADAW